MGKITMVFDLGLCCKPRLTECAARSFARSAPKLASLMNKTDIHVSRILFCLRPDKVVKSLNLCFTDRAPPSNTICSLRLCLYIQATKYEHLHNCRSPVVSYK